MFCISTSRRNRTKPWFEPNKRIEFCGCARRFLDKDGFSHYTGTRRTRGTYPRMSRVLHIYYTVTGYIWCTQTSKNTHFAWAGGTCPRFAWAGGTFSPVVQFLVLAGNRFWFYILFMYLGYRIVPYSCSVVLVFLVLAGNSFWCYVRT